MKTFKDMVDSGVATPKYCFHETPVNNNVDMFIRYYMMWWGLYSETNIRECCPEELNVDVNVGTPVYVITGRYAGKKEYMYNLFNNIHVTTSGSMFSFPCRFYSVLDKYGLFARIIGDRIYLFRQDPENMKAAIWFDLD